MSERRPKLLFDALAAIEAAQSFLAGLDLAAYEADAMRRSAIERQLEILGEACARLAREDDEAFDRLPAARTAVGLRNRIIYGYDAVDDETVYRTVIDVFAGAEGRTGCVAQRVPGRPLTLPARSAPICAAEPE